jgi:hypothetical protein
MQAIFIPLLPLSSRHPTPVKFGNAVNFIGAFSLLGRDSWLVVNALRFIMPYNKQAVLSCVCIFLTIFLAAVQAMPPEPQTSIIIATASKIRQLPPTQTGHPVVDLPTIVDKLEKGD